MRGRSRSSRSAARAPSQEGLSPEPRRLTRARPHQSSASAGGDPETKERKRSWSHPRASCSATSCVPEARAASAARSSSAQSPRLRISCCAGVSACAQAQRISAAAAVRKARGCRTRARAAAAQQDVDEAFRMDARAPCSRTARVVQLLFRSAVSQRARRNAYGKLQPMQIGELLIREGHLTQEGLEEALDWQVLYGGRLGTNLLELRVVEEKHLAQALGRQLGCETAWGDLELPPEMIGIIPNHVADRHEMVPWKLEKRRLKVLCTEIKLEQLDQLGYKLGHACIPVVAPEFRVFNLLRAHYKATRQMRALDFGVVPEEGRRRRKPKQEKVEVPEPAPELIDEAAFNNIYNNVLAGRGAVPKDMPLANWAPPLVDPVAPPVMTRATPEATPRAPASSPPQEVEALESLPEEAILGELPAEAIEAAAGPAAPELKAVHWEEAPTQPPPARDESPLAFEEALRLLAGVTDRDSIAHIVLRASRS